MMYNMSYGQHQLVYNFTSFTLASMMACTVFFWLRLSDIHDKYKTAMCITGLVRWPSFSPVVNDFIHDLPARLASQQVASLRWPAAIPWPASR